MTGALLALLSSIYQEWLLPRLAVAASLGFIMLALWLAGCSTAPTEREIIAAHELVGFDWCSPAQLHQCPMIRQGNELFLLEPGQSVGDGARVWDVIGVTVDAFSEDE